MPCEPHHSFLHAMLKFQVLRKQSNTLDLFPQPCGNRLMQGPAYSVHRKAPHDMYMQENIQDLLK